MAGIDPSSPLLAHIRAHAVAWRRTSEARGRPRVSASGVQQPTDWLGQVALEVVAIPADVPQRQRRAFRIYLQALLARECGVDDPHRPAFQALVDRVLETMAQEPSLDEAIVKAGALLLESAGA